MAHAPAYVPGRFPLSPRALMYLVATVIVVISACVGPLFLGRYGTLVFFEVLQLLALAQAWNLLAGYGGLVSLAPAASVGLGGYAAAIIGIHLGLPLPALVVGGGLLAAVFAALVSVPMFRFRGLYFTIATLVLAEALRLFMINWKVLGGAKGLFLPEYAPSASTLYYYALALAVLTSIVVLVGLRTRLGLSLRALRDDEDTAQEMGVSTFRTKLWVFVVSSFFMGMVGGLQMVRLGVIEPYGAFSLTWTINTVTTAIVGGVGTIMGPVVGAGFTVWLGEALSRYPEIHVAITGAIVIVMIRFAPMGVWGIITLISRKLRPSRPTPDVEEPASHLPPATSGEAIESRAASSSVCPAAPRAVSEPACGRVGSSGPSCTAGSVLLRCTGITKRYGDVVAVDNIGLELVEGQALGIIGPNGAGKSTLVGTLNGALMADSGTVEFNGVDVTHLAPFRRARLGIGRTHQIPRPFGQMTVLENLMVARSYGGRNYSSGDIRRDCQSILAEVELADVAQTLASNLTLLQLKRLELARALAMEPTVLLMDEIGAGLIESELADLISLVQSLRGRVKAMIIIEHIMDVIQQCCDRVMVLDWGKLIAEGPTLEVLTSPDVISCYLGRRGGEPGALGREKKPPEEATLILEVSGVSAGYGHFRALNDVTLAVRLGEVVALLGANGAGKTTLARVVSGMIPVTSGKVTFSGADITMEPAHVISRRGLAHCMEGRHIFADLSVEENLVLAGTSAKTKAELRERLDRVYSLFDILAERRQKSGHHLSGGQQQMLAIGRALMSDPHLIIFDEISLGLAPATVDRLYDTLVTIRDRGITMLIIEQNVERGLALADRVYVMEKGSIALGGSPDELRGSSKLVSLYVRGLAQESVSTKTV